METAHDPAALTPEQVLHEHGPRVYSLARRLLGNDADAEDVTQEVFLRLLRKMDSFRGESSFPTWLSRVTVNAALAHRRGRAVRERHRTRQEVDLLPVEGSPGGPVRRWSEPPDQQALDRETHELIEAAIAGLPVKYRDVYVLADVEGLANADIAGMLKLGLPAVKSRLHRARLLMRRALAPHFEEATP